MLSTRPFLLAVLAALALPAGAGATTYTVNPGEKIQDAVSKAAAGDTIAIKAATFQESVSVDKPGLTFTGDPGATVLSPSTATGSTPTFTFTATSGDPDVMSGLILINLQTTGPVVQAPAVGLIVRDSTVLGSQGDGIDFTGSDKNLVQRTTISTLAAAGSAVAISAATGDTAAKKLTLDSTVLDGHNALAASYAAPSTAAAPGITVDARHVTAIGDTVADASKAVLPAGAQPIGITYLDSIVRGKRTATPSSGGVAAAIAADTARNSVADTAGDAAALFVNPAKFNFHLRADAPVLGKGKTTAGESATDIDGQPRAVNGGSDLGADQFVDRAPKAALAAVATTIRQTQSVSFDASKSTDPDTGDAVVAYRWDFGDGQTATTTTPTTTHVYGTRGAATATVTAIDKTGTASDPATLAITVTDGVRPTIKVSSPFAKQTISAYKAKRRLPVVLFGTAADDNAMGKVYLALRPVAKAGRKCRWFDGKRSLKTAECTAPVLFEAALTGTQWRFRLPLRARLPKGRYVLYAAAVDASGLPGATQTVKFRIR